MNYKHCRPIDYSNTNNSAIRAAKTGQARASERPPGHVARATVLAGTRDTAGTCRSLHHCLGGFLIWKQTTMTVMKMVMMTVDV